MATTIGTFEAFLAQYLKKFGVESVRVRPTDAGLEIHTDGTLLMTIKPHDPVENVGRWLERSSEEIARKLTGAKTRLVSDLSDAELLDLFETAVRNHHEIPVGQTDVRDGTISSLRKDIIERMGAQS